MQQIVLFVRKNLFPNIKDWRSNHDELRFKVEWWEMKWFEFVTFHWLPFT